MGCAGSAGSIKMVRVLRRWIRGVAIATSEVLDLTWHSRDKCELTHERFRCKSDRVIPVFFAYLGASDTFLHHTSVPLYPMPSLDRDGPEEPARDDMPRGAREGCMIMVSYTARWTSYGKYCAALVRDLATLPICLAPACTQ